MAGGVVDRGEWAVVVRELLDLESAPLTPGGKQRIHGAKTRFATKVGITARTVDTWVDRQVDVKESSVRAVADAYGINTMDLLVRVGFYDARQLPTRPTPQEIIDEEILLIADSDLDDQTKAAFIQELERLRAEDRDIQERMAARDKERRMAALRERIEQARRVG